MLDLIIQDFEHFQVKEMFNAFIMLFVAIDIIGAIPIVLSLKDSGKDINPPKTTLLSGIMLIAFLFIGEPLLAFFGVDISSFAVAGAVVLFVLAVEMIFGIQVFKDDGPSSSGTIVPLVFPLFAGAASFTAMLTLRGDGVAATSVLGGLLMNILAIFLMLRFVSPIEKFLGKSGIYILRKFFGVLLLAISVKFFTGNILKVIDNMEASNQRERQEIMMRSQKQDHPKETEESNKQLGEAVRQ